MSQSLLKWGGFYISKHTTVNGNISSDRSGSIAGTVNGDVTINGMLTVEKGAILNGDLYAKNIVVKGVIKGNVYSEGKVYACKNSEVHGNIFAREAIIDKESLVKGALAQIQQRSIADEDAGQEEESLAETNIAALAHKLLPDDPPESWF